MSETGSILTEKQRDFLNMSEEERHEQYTKQQRSYYRRKIRQRIRAGLEDFQLLVDELPDTERDEIFAAASQRPRTPEYSDLEEDVMHAIMFLYMGMGGESKFRWPLKDGVSNAEVALGNAEIAVDIDPEFTVDPVRDASLGEVVDLVEEGDADRLSPRDLFLLVNVAVRKDAIDFDAIREDVEFMKWVAEYGRFSKRRPIPGGKHTPLIPVDVYEEQGIGDMSGEELRELFGEGYASRFVFYDGEQIFRAPTPGSDDDPEVLEVVDYDPDEK